MHNYFCIFVLFYFAYTQFYLKYLFKTRHLNKIPEFVVIGEVPLHKSF